MVKKKFIVEGCLFCWKYHQISIEIYQNFKFLTFLSKFLTLYCNLDNRNRCYYVPQKIDENIVQKNWQFSICNDLFQFFGCMVKKKFIVEVYFFCLKYHQISIEIYQFFKFLAFWWKFLYRNLENRNRCEYVSTKIYESIFQK